METHTLQTEGEVLKDGNIGISGQEYTYKGLLLV
jgi:hypothetical protein